MTKTTDYAVTLRVSSLVLPTLLQVIDRTRGIALTSIAVMAETAPETPAAPRPSRYAGGKRDKGITADALLLELLSERGRTMAQLEDEFFKRGFARNTASPQVSKKMKEGGIVRTGSIPYVYALKGGTP